MSYKKALEELRAQLFSFAQTPTTPKQKNSFIENPMFAKQELKDIKTTPYTEWLSHISKAAQEIKDSAKKSAEKSTPAEAFVSSMEQTIANPVEAVPEENRETFIRRRSDGPSYYAPRPSKADTFKDLIDTHEGAGDYDTLYSHSQRSGKRFDGVKVSEMTIGELKAFANGEYGKWSKAQLGYKATPMGRYQFVGSTLASVAKQMGLPDDTVFSPEVQDSMFEYWVGKTIEKGDSVDEKVDLLRGQWEGFKNVKRSTLADLVIKYGA